MKEPEFATSADPLWNRIPEHLRNGLKRYLDNHIQPGDFLMALLTNDLMRCFQTGDENSLKGLNHLVMYLYWEVGTDCYGSQEKVDKWLGTGPSHDKHRL